MRCPLPGHPNVEPQLVLRISPKERYTLSMRLLAISVVLAATRAALPEIRKWLQAEPQHEAVKIKPVATAPAPITLSRELSS